MVRFTHCECNDEDIKNFVMKGDLLCTVLGHAGHGTDEIRLLALLST